MTETGTVGWATPEDGGLAGGVGFPEESLGDIFSVELLSGLGSGDLIEGTIEIDGAEYGGGVGAANFFFGHEAGSPDDERGADSAFIHPGLRSAKWAGGAGAGFVTVVGTHRDDGVVSEFGIVADAIKEAGELFVHGVENAVVECAFAASPFIERWPEWTVDVVGPEVDEEGFLFCLRFVDELECLVNETGGDFESLHPLVSFPKAFGICPDASADRVASFWVGLHGEREKFGADSPSKLVSDSSKP